MRPRLRDRVAVAACRLGVPAVLRRMVPARRVGILLYHDPEPGRLDAHLELIRRHHEVVALDLLVHALETGRWDAVPARAIVLTFDDGLRGNAALGDVLRRHGAPATIYLCSALVGTSRRYWFKVPGVDPEPLKALPDARRLAVLAERHGFHPEDEAAPEERQALDRTELETLRDVATFGAHTRTHPILPRCDDGTAASEIVGAKAELEQALGRPCEHFAYPNGAYGSRELELVRGAGYRSARTTALGWNGPRTDRHRLVVVTDGADDLSVPALALHLAGAGIAWARLRRLAGRPRG